MARKLGLKSPDAGQIVRLDAAHAGAQRAGDGKHDADFCSFVAVINSGFFKACGMRALTELIGGCRNSVGRHVCLRERAVSSAKPVLVFG